MEQLIDIMVMISVIVSFVVMVGSVGLATMLVGRAFTEIMNYVNKRTVKKRRK